MADPGAGGPLVVACLRYADPWPQADSLTGAVWRSGHGAGASPAELAALETALRVAERWGGRVLAVTAGPPAAESVLRSAVTAGAEALRVEWPALEYPAELGGDEEPLAAALAAALAGYGAAAGSRGAEPGTGGLAGRPQAAGPALVICGDRSPDRGTGAVPGFLAAGLGAAQALGLVALAAAGDEPADGLEGERRLPGGRRERLRIPVPAVCSVEAAGVRLRRAPLGAALAAGAAVIPVTAPLPLGSRVRVGAPRRYVPRTHDAPAAPAGSARERLIALSGALDRREPRAVVGPLGAEEAAGELLGYLRRSGYLADEGGADGGGADGGGPGAGGAAP